MRISGTATSKNWAWLGSGMRSTASGATSSTHQAQLRVGGDVNGDYAYTAYLQLAGDRLRRRGADRITVASQHHLVIGDQAGAGVDQTQRQVRLAAA